MKKHFLTAIALACACTASFAAPSFGDDHTGGFLVYGVGGTSGVGLGIGTQISKNFAVRAESTRLNANINKNVSNLDFSGEVKAGSDGIYADYHPFDGAFRLTGGVLTKAPSGTLTADPTGGGVTIGGTYYPVDIGERVIAKVKYPSTMPYVGIGWGFTELDKPGVKFGFDIGAGIGKPTASLDATPLLKSMPNAEANIRKEEVKLNDKLGKIGVFPMLKLSVGYAF